MGSFQYVRGALCTCVVCSACGGGGVCLVYGLWYVWFAGCARMHTSVYVSYGMSNDSEEGLKNILSSAKANVKDGETWGQTIWGLPVLSRDDPLFEVSSYALLGNVPWSNEDNLLDRI